MQTYADTTRLTITVAKQSRFAGPRLAVDLYPDQIATGWAPTTQTQKPSLEDVAQTQRICKVAMVSVNKRSPGQGIQQRGSMVSKGRRENLTGNSISWLLS